MADRSALSANAHRALEVSQELIKNNLNVQNIIDSLVSAQILTPTEKDRLNALRKESTQAAITLIGFLETKTQQQWHDFLAILRDHSEYQDLVSELENFKISQDDILIKGGVPIFPDLIERKNDIKRIHEALQISTRSRSHPTCVVLIYGMGGIGKTSLAAEALRSCSALSTLCKHGVIWKSVPHIKQNSDEPVSDRQKNPNFDEPIKKLIEEILKHPVLETTLNATHASGQQQRTTLNELIDQLRAALLHCSLLLAIDDVWHEEVLRVFVGMRVTILATCRNRLLAESLPKGCVLEIEVNSCSNVESEAILKNHFLADDEEKMQIVIKKCQGLPIVLSAVASLLRDKSIEQKQSILNDLDAETILSSKVVRPEYKYLDQVLGASLHDLKHSEDLRFGRTIITGVDLLHCYLDLAALDNGEPLFVDKLAALLCTKERPLLPTMHVDRVLECLHKRSLLTKTGQRHSKSDGKTQDIFTIHDVQLDFLRIWKMPDKNSSDLIDRHKHWVSGFLISKHCLDQQTKDDDGIRWDDLSQVIRKIAFGEQWWQCIDAFSRTFLGDNLFEQRVMQLFINEKDELQWTALHYSASEGNCELAEALLLRKADINARTEMKFTPLHLAAQNGHIKLAELLVKLKADINAGEHKQFTPLHLAALNGHHKLAELLLLGKADINARHYKQATPLHLAASNGHHELVYALLQKGADFNVREHKQGTPLHLAAQNGHREVAELLVQKGADINAQAGMNFTPLHLAAKNGYHELAEALVKLGADKNALLTTNLTPLQLATENGHREVAEVLNTQYINARKEYQITPSYAAAKNGPSFSDDQFCSYPIRDEQNRQSIFDEKRSSTCSFL